MAIAVARTSTNQSQGRTWRTYAYPAVAGLFALGSLVMLDGVREGIMPWADLGIEGLYASYIPHRFLGAMHGAMVGWLFAGSLIASLRRSTERPLLVQFYALSHLLVVLIFSVFFFNPFFMVMFGVTTALLIAVYPAPRSIFALAPRGPLSLPLIGLSLAAALLHLPGIVASLARQHAIIGQSPADPGNYWLGPAVTPILLVVAGLLAATRRPGWRPLGILTGLTYLFLGAAAISVPADLFSWGAAGGGLAVLGGIAYIVAALREGRADAAA